MTSVFVYSVCFLFVIRGYKPKQHNELDATEYQNKKKINQKMTTDSLVGPFTQTLTNSIDSMSASQCFSLESYLKNYATQFFTYLSYVSLSLRDQSSFQIHNTF